MARSVTRAAVRRGALGTAVTAATLLAPLLGPGTSRLVAQSVSLSAVGAHANNELLDDMGGARLVIEAPFGTGSLAFRLGATGLRSARSGSANTCSGFIPPDLVCSREPVRNTGNLTWGLIGVSGRLYGRPGMEVRLAADALAGNVTSRVRGQTTGRELKGSELVMGGSADATLRWFPRGGRLGVSVGVGYSAFALPRGEDCVDCYVAFSKGFGVGEGTVGVMYRVR